MEERQRVVRALSQETERPYFTISYRLSLTGKDLFTQAFDPSNTNSLSSKEGVAGLQDDILMRGQRRMQRSQSAIAPGQELGGIHEVNNLQSQMPGTPKSQFTRKKPTWLETINAPSPFLPPPPPVTLSPEQHQQQHPNYPSQNKSHQPHQGDELKIGESKDAKDQDNQDPDFPLHSRPRRTRSAATMFDLQLARGTPPVPEELLIAPKSQLSVRPTHTSHPTRTPGEAVKAGTSSREGEGLSIEEGLVTCLNSKHIWRYEVGQTFRRAVIIGIDEEQSKIILFQKSLAPGMLTVLRSKNSSRYEKGYPVHDVNGQYLGLVHSVDRVQDLLVINRTPPYQYQLP